MPQWPPPREKLCRATIRIISLHNLPKRGELRPKVQGSREACHKFAPKLTTTQHAPPDSGELSCPSVSLALHAIGGFAAVTDTLPLKRVRTKHSTVSVSSNGLNPQFDHSMHCLAAEPDQTFLRIAVVDGKYRQTAYYLLLTTYYILHNAYYLLHTTYYILHTIYCVLLTAYCLLLTTYYILHTTYCILRTTYYILHTAYCMLLTTYCSLLTAYCLLLTTYCILHTTYYLLLTT